MIAHPLILAVIVVDGASLLLLCAATVGALRVIVGWRPTEPSREQLVLERRAESIWLHTTAGATLFLVSSLIFVLAIASVLPGVVPGAMCGTGVLQALGIEGHRALGFRGAALATLGAWRVTTALSRSEPSSPLTSLSSRLLVLALPSAVLSALSTAEALVGLELGSPVDCCTMVYDLAAGAGETQNSSNGVPWSVFMSLIAMVLIALSAFVLWKRRFASSSALALILAGLSWLWIPIASLALTRQLAAYHYGVLAHECPWCLFAARHHLVGYVLYGSLFVVAYEGLSMLIATLVRRGEPLLSAAATRLIGRAALRLLLATLLFLLVAVAPALLWRFRHGLWIDG